MCESYVMLHMRRFIQERAMKLGNMRDGGGAREEKERKYGNRRGEEEEFSFERHVSEEEEIMRRKEKRNNVIRWSKRKGYWKEEKPGPVNEETLRGRREWERRVWHIRGVCRKD